MIKKSTLLHLRIPFSFYLLPVFVFAWSISTNVDWVSALWAFIIIHVFLYPASNAYNSYFDKDTKSIGGLEKPPTVTKELYYTALVFDGIAVLLGFLICWQFSLMLFIYGLVSKAYSHPAIRIKKYPFASWFIAGLFQGFFTFLMSCLALNNYSISQILNSHFIYPALLSSAILWGSYPMTQVYQHAEDSRRGDATLSIKLGVLGTFHFTALLFTLSAALYCWYFYITQGYEVSIVYILFLTPVLIYFSKWYFDVRRDPSKADFKSTMRLNLISSIFLNCFFLWLGLMNQI